MKKLILLLCFVATSLAVDDFFASTPRELRPGMPYYIDIAFRTFLRGAVTIEAKIKQTNNAREVSVAWSGASNSTTIDATYHTGRITIQVPGDLLAETKYYLFLEVDGLIQPSKEVVVATVPNLIFVQTDRGIYKPSASLNDETKVKLRVLRVNDELKPVMGDNLKLEIKDPRNETIWLKRDFPHDKGIAEAEWVVPRDPVYGTYIALAEGDWGKANATFDVQKYELPKFELQCTLDNSYVVDPFYFGETKGDVTIEGSCKAVYTYGAYVKGTMKIKAGNAEETFTNFDGEERFSLRIVRNIQGEDNQIEVFAEMTEQFTEDTANATMSFSVYDAEHRALVIKPIPNTLEGDSDYKFFAQLVDASGQRVQNFQNFRWFVRAVLKYNSFTYNEPQQTSTETYEGTLSSNPVEIVLPSGKSKGNGAYYSEINVMFNEAGRESLPEKFSPTRYKSDTNQALFINIMDKDTKKEISNTEAYEYNGSEVCFKVRKSGTETLGAVFYQIIGTTYPDQLMKVTGPITCVTITKHMAPKAMLIAYTIVGKEGNKEILAASLTFDVTWKSPHKVSITITPAEARPNQDVNIHIKTEGQALVGLDGIDKSILFLAGVKSLTEDRIKQKLGENRMFGREEKQESNYLGPMPMFRSYIPFPSGPETTSAGAKIKDAGLMVISNANVYGNQDQGRNYYFYPMAAGIPEDYDFEFDDYGAGGNEQEDAMASVPTSEENASKPKQTSSIRKDFPETWLFDVVTTDANGEFDLQKRCPGTITTFLVNGYAMNEAKGLGVAEQAQLKCFQPFFVRANLPYSMKKGEESDFQMLVFNYYTEAIGVRVSLKENPMIFSTKGPTSTVLTVQPGSSAEFKVPIKPTKIGAHDVEVAAVWSDRGITDKVIKQLRIEPPGKEIRVYKEISVDVDSSETRSATFGLEEFFVETMTYIVPESLKMEIQVSGDMIGAFISNLEGAMPMPTGCGEQNMITVIPSVFLFPYLKNIDRDTPDMREKVARYCAKGYAKELVYKHRDGSFSAFGEGPGLCGCMPFGMVDGEEDDTFPSKPGSSWLTAFVLYVFSIMGEQELTYVNHDTLHESFVFLKKTHGRDGHFEVIGDVVHQEMKGGTSEKIGYSAYVLLAFTNYKKFLDKTPTATDQQKEDVRTMIDGGKQWLIARKDNSMTKFEIGIVALFMARNGEYAEARALLAKAEGAKMALNCPKNSYGPPEEAHIAPCWKTKSRETRCDPSDKTSCAEGQVCCQTNCPGYRCVPGQGPSLVETKGYLALAYLALNDYADHKDKIKPNVDWLLENRKGSHFDNTQDTAVALQALAEYGLKFKDDAVADFTVSVPANSPVSSPASVDVDSSNYEILQRQPLDVQWTSDIKSKIVTANVAGTFGKAFVTLSVIFHSTNEKQVPKVLDLTVDATKPVNGSITHIKSCWRGRKPVTDDDPKISNMVVVEISLQTGTRYKEESANLEDLELAGVTKIEKDIGKVILYFEPEEKKKYDHDNCVYLPVEKEFEVRNVAMGKVKGYDYYAMSESTQEAFYATEDCYENCGPPGPTGPTTGASSIYISGLLLVGALLITLAGFRME